MVIFLFNAAVQKENISMALYFKIAICMLSYTDLFWHYPLVCEAKIPSFLDEPDLWSQFIDGYFLHTLMT